MSNRGRNPNSLANLAKGRTKGKGKGKPSNASGPTWKELIESFGQLEPGPELCAAAGLTVEACRALGLKKPTWKALAVARAYRETNNPTIFKELMDRSEGKLKDEIDHNIKGELEVFNHDAITGLLAGRSSRDHSASGSNQGS